MNKSDLLGVRGMHNWERWLKAGALGGVPVRPAPHLELARKLWAELQAGSMDVWHPLHDALRTADAEPEDIGTTYDQMARKYDEAYRNWLAAIPAEGVWRNELRPTEAPTVSFIVIYAIDDKIAELGIFTLEIRHVRGFHGKAFSFRVKSRYGGSSETGDTIYGTNQATYDKALAAGRIALQRNHDRHEEEMAALRNLQAPT